MASAEIAVENFVASAPEKTAGEFFPADPKPQVLRGSLRAGEAAAPPVQKIGDESDKARVHEV